MGNNDTKSKILTSAIMLFALNGYEKTTIRNIAEKVGISSASIYYFYSSKESLLDAIFSEFEVDFAKYRNKPQDIIKEAENKPLPKVLSLMLYTFGSAEEHERIMGLTRIVLSLQYENKHAHEIYERIIIQDATDYIIEVLKGLNRKGKIKKVNYKWIAFILLSFSIAILNENVLYMRPFGAADKEYGEGIKYICSIVSETIKVDSLDN